MQSILLSVSFWQKIDDIDKWLFIKLNSGLTNPVFDLVLPYFRDSVFWAPLYVFIAAFVALNFKHKGIFWSLAFLCTLAITDLGGTYVFKENFQRLRPCQDPLFFGEVRLLLKHCSASYSFISNHAANHFGLATFMVLSMKNIIGWPIYLFYLWAFLVGFAQVYVGVHYPGDVIGGAIVGILAGWFTAWIYGKYVNNRDLINK